MFNNFVVYGNSDYLDILTIQSDFITKYSGYKILFINKVLGLDHIYDRYDEVIFYDNDKPYATRLLECVNQLKLKYFLLIHDIDILLSVDIKIISGLFELMSDFNIHRLDLKHTGDLFSDSYITLDGVKSIEIPDKDIFLVKQNDPGNFIYNVNPSIWRKTAFMDLLTTYSDRSYRDIERPDVQQFCTKFNVYKIFSKNFLSCGYFQCVEFFKFLHISHSGKILSLNEQFVTEYDQSYSDASKDFIEIVDKYQLKKSNKWR